MNSIDNDANTHKLRKTDIKTLKNSSIKKNNNKSKTKTGNKKII